MKKIKLGFMQGRLSPRINGKIQSFPFKTWEKEFLIAKKIKLDRIEWTIDNYNFYKNPILTKVGRKNINKLKEKNNIKINSVTCDFLMTNPFFKKKIYKKNLKFFSFLESCSDLNIRIIVVPLVDNGSLKNKIEENNTITFFKGIENFLKKRKLLIAFESDFSPIKLKKFINKFNPKTFGINYDIGNSAGLNYDYKIEMKYYFHRILNLHIKDKDQTNKTVPLFSGRAKILEIIRYFVSKRYNGNYILQPARSNFDHINMINNYRKIFENYATKK